MVQGYKRSYIMIEQTVFNTVHTVRSVMRHFTLRKSGGINNV